MSEPLPMRRPAAFPLIDGITDAAAVSALFPNPVTNPIGVIAHPITDRETARWLVTQALTRNGVLGAASCAAEIVPGGMLKMETRRLDAASRAAVAAAMWAAAWSQLAWSNARIASAFGASWGLVAANREIFNQVLSAHAPLAMRRGLTDLADAVVQIRRGE